MAHIAVTGTKGKTTITRIVQHVLMSQEKSVFGEYGNDGSFVNGKRDSSFRPADAYFRRSEAKDCDFVVSEATSYVLSLDVYDDNMIDVGVFTGFEESEHSELYDNPDLYLKSKQRIFNFLNQGSPIFVCRDDLCFDKIIDSRAENILTYGKHKDSDFLIEDVKESVGETTFSLTDSLGEKHTIKSTLYGTFNVYNTAAAFAVCQHLNIPNHNIIDSISKFPGVKGRGNVYHIVDTNTVVVIDYAHTPRSLEYQLNFLKENKGTRKLVTIFGCGGNKSAEKRPLMGRVASELSDYVVLTNDNPREEHPREILYDIISGISKLDSVEVYPDREEAIKRSLSGFHNSLILIAGKGNEKELEIDGKIIQMTDFSIIDKWLVQNAYSVRGFFDYLD